jgi:hypothetical protein
MSYHGTRVVVIEIPEGSGGYVNGNNNRLRTEWSLSRNRSCAFYSLHDLSERPGEHLRASSEFRAIAEVSALIRITWQASWMLPL